MGTFNKTTVDLSELKKSISNLQDDRREAAEGLLSELVFLDGTLDKLKARIDKEGPIIKTKRGQTETTKENPALKSYNTSIMRYCQLLKQLTDLLPKPTEAAPADPLIDFIKGGK